MGQGETLKDLTNYGLCARAHAKAWQVTRCLHACWCEHCQPCEMQAEELGHIGRNMTANAIVEATDLREAQLAWAKRRPAKVARRSGHSPSTEIGPRAAGGTPNAICSTGWAGKLSGT